jgi:hypothetical protein
VETVLSEEDSTETLTMDKEKDYTRPHINVETVLSEEDYEDKSDDGDQLKILNALCRQAKKKHGPRKQTEKKVVLFNQKTLWLIKTLFIRNWIRYLLDTMY